jgi:NAD(P)-dependent dehydrogenase (short-subunit alcohol dehydrogenase family)
MSGIAMIVGGGSGMGAACARKLAANAVGSQSERYLENAADTLQYRFKAIIASSKVDL